MSLDASQLLAKIRKRKAELEDGSAAKKPALDPQQLLAKVRARKAEIARPNPYEAGPARKPRPLIFNRQGTHIALAEQARERKEVEALKESVAPAFSITKPPEREWWDEPADITDEIFCPAPIEAPADRLDVGEIRAFMTKREMKRMRKHNRYEQRREVQDRIRLGLDPPPPAKMSQKNVVAVVGAEYYADPTKFEQMAAAQVASRRQTHLETNAARKLDGDAKWAKNVAKAERDRAKGLNCGVIKFNGVVSGERRYILDAAAQKLVLTGVLLCTEPFSLAIVEGGALEVKKFKKLAAKTQERDSAGAAQVVWHGELRQAKFKRWSTHAMPGRESLELLQSKDAESYWRLAARV